MNVLLFDLAPFSELFGIFQCIVLIAPRRNTRHTNRDSPRIETATHWASKRMILMRNPLCAIFVEPLSCRRRFNAMNSTCWEFYFQFNDNLTAPPAPLIHSQLRTLTINHSDGFIFDFLFERLSLPSLESLSYEISRELTTQSNALIELLVRSHPLRHLSLARVLMDIGKFFVLMTCVPQLEETTRSFDYFLAKLGESHISNHSESSSDPPFLPRLRSLKYRYHGIHTLYSKFIPIAFGKDTVSSDNAIRNETFRRPLQSLTIAIERPSRYVAIESFQREPRL